MLDEAQVLRDETVRNGQHPLSALIVAINTLQEQELPIGLVLCGLPSFSSSLLRACTYSEWMFRGEQIGALGRRRRPTHCCAPSTAPPSASPLRSSSASPTRSRDTPFFLQLWGAELWEAAQDSHRVRPRPARCRRGRDLPTPRRRLLRPARRCAHPCRAGPAHGHATCPYPPLASTDIRRRSGKSDANVNVLMGRLSDQGVVYRLHRGQYDNTAPQVPRIPASRGAAASDDTCRREYRRPTPGAARHPFSGGRAFRHPIRARHDRTRGVPV